MLGIRDEQGFEAFYNVAVTPWLCVGPDIQVVRPMMKGNPNTVFATLRVNIKF